MRPATCVIAAAALLLGGCLHSDEPDEAAYAERNAAELEGVPPPPRARLKRTLNRAYRASDTGDAPITGYWTIRDYSLPRVTEPKEVISFYKERLRGWTLLQQSAAPSLSYRKGDAYLHILVGPGAALVELDHDCFKGTNSPECG